MEKITIINARNIEKQPSLMPGPNKGFDITLEVEDYDMVRDGYHTIRELYDHRVTLFVALCRHMHELLGMENPGKFKIWRSQKHSDGNHAYDGWFIMGIGTEKGKQITYHLPLDQWSETSFAETLEKAPEWDEHTSDDVLKRLKVL